MLDVDAGEVDLQTETCKCIPMSIFDPCFGQRSEEIGLGSEIHFVFGSRFLKPHLMTNV